MITAEARYSTDISRRTLLCHQFWRGEKDYKFGIILDSNQNHRMAKMLLAVGRSTARIISRAPPPDLECLLSFSRGCSCNAAEK